jgi:hypothetical protein|tara:strand:- start:593 stop:775 length:183 start_codon:yes stop_codon:yes gene_type:complete
MPNKCEKEAAMIKAFERLLQEFSPSPSLCSARNGNRKDAGAKLIWDNAYKALSEFKQGRE